MGVKKASDAVRDQVPRSRVVEAYRQHRDALVQFATVLVGPDDAQDLVSAALIRVLDRAGIDSPKAYMYRAVATQAHNHIRGEARRRRRERLSTIWEVPATTPEPYPEVRAAIEALSVRQRAVVYLTYWEDLSDRDIASHLGIGAGSVRRHLARARQHLRGALHGYEV